MKHTPGPWELSEAQYKDGFGTYRRVEQVEQFGDVVASVCIRHAVNHTLDACGDANARLIASAPDLLEALVELSKSFVDTYFDDPRSDDEIDAHQVFWENKARAAIAKATGEQP